MSSHLRNLERRLILFGGLAVVLGAALALMPDASTSVKKESLPLVFDGFDTDDVVRVELTRGKRKLILQDAGEGRWHLDSHFRYPLSAAPKSLLDAIASARITSEVTGRKETFGKYAGSLGWIEVATVDNRGQETVRFAIGRYTYPETFLRLGTGKDQRIVKATSISETEASLEVRSWIETRMWPRLSSSKFVRIDVEQRRDNRTITIARRGESPADVEMAVPAADPKGGKLYWMDSPVKGDAKKLSVEDLTREFTGMLIHSVVAGSTTPNEDAKFGFDDPEIIATLYHRAGESVHKHKLIVGKREPGTERWWVRRGGSSWVFLVDASSGVSRMRQSPQEFLELSDAEKDAKKKKDAAKGPAMPPK